VEGIPYKIAVCSNDCDFSELVEKIKL